MSKKKQRGILNSWLEIRDKCRFKRPLCILMFILPLISWFFYFSYPLLSFPLTHFSIEFILSLLPLLSAYCSLILDPFPSNNINLCVIKWLESLGTQCHLWAFCRIWVDRSQDPKGLSHALHLQIKNIKN